MPQAWWHTNGQLARECAVDANHQFGYSPVELRRAWNVLHRAAETGHVFTTLQRDNPRTT